MPKRVQFESKIHEFPDDFTDDEIGQALSSLTPVPTPRGGGVLETAGEVAKGVGKGVMSSTAALLSGVLPGFPDRPEVRAVTQPSGTAQKVGFGLEQGAEFLAPMGAVTKLSKIGQAAIGGMRGARALNIGTRAALEGTGAAGVAAVQSGGDPTAMRNAALTGTALSAGAGILAAGAKPLASALKKSAVEQYGRVLSPGKEGMKYLSRKEVVPGMIERGVISRSIEGLEKKASERVAEYGKKIADAWDNLPAGTKVVADDIITKLDDAITPHTVVNSAGQRIPIAGGQAKQAISNIEDIQTMLLDVAEPNYATGKLEIPVEKLRSLRQYWDDYAALAGKFQGKTLAEASQAKAQGIAADYARKELGKDFPDIAKLNKEFSFWKNAELVAKETAQRRVGQTKGLIRRLAGAAGTVGGFASGGVQGAIVGKVTMDQLEKTASSVGWNTVSAVTKDRIAKALATGNRGMAEFYIGKAAKAAATSAAANRPAETLSPAR